MLGNLIESTKNAAREFAEVERLFSEDKSLRTLVFYGERDIFYHFFEDYIDYILANSNLRICYITSDVNDPIFHAGNDRIVPFYIKNLLSTAFSRLDSKVLVLSTPDLNQGFVKRAPPPVHHVYAMHGIASTHLAFRPGAFDFFDSVLCIGEYQVTELRKMEELKQLPPKQLVLTGYPLAERVHRDFVKYKSQAPQRQGKPPLILVAPTWGPSSIPEVCPRQLIDSLAGTRFEVWIRPHPEFVKRKAQKLAELEKLANSTANVRVRLDFESFECLQLADVLITDHSCIAVDYALGTERQVVYIDTPTRVDNPNWKDLGLEPIDLKYRYDLGTAVTPEQLEKLPSILESIISSDNADFRARLPELRPRLVANWLKAGQIGGQHILDLCKEQA